MLKKFLLLLLRVSLIFVLLPVCGYLFFDHLEHSGFFNLKKIELNIVDEQVTGLYLQPLQKQLESNLQKYQNQSLVKMDFTHLVADVGSLTWIESVAYSRVWPSELKIVIVPKEIKLLFQSKQRLLPVVKTGEVLPPIEMKRAPNVSILVGDGFDQIELRKKALQFVSQIPEKGEFSREKISEIRYDQKEGFWTSLVESGIKVKMGDEDFALKSARVSQVLQYLEQNNFNGRVIDANLSKKVLVRLRKDP